MGVTDHFAIANATLRRKFGYHLDPEGSEQFRELLGKIGIRRFDQAVTFLAERRDRFSSKGQLHRALVSSMKLMVPRKPVTTKPRSFGARYGREIGRELDADMSRAIALDRCPHGKREIVCEVCADVAAGVIPF